MGIKAYITDVAKGLRATVDNKDGCEKNALVVATRPLKLYNNKPTYLTSSDGSKDMNVAVTFGGVPVKVYDGDDSVLWTGSTIQGTAFTFGDASQNHTPAGAQSVEINDAAVMDIMQIAKGSDLDCTGYSALTFWIYVDRGWLIGDSILLYGWDTGTGLQVGTSIKLEEHFDYSVNDTWLKVAVSLVDMGALATSTTLDSLRVEIVARDGGPKFYLDDIQFEETGSTVEFSLIPREGTWLHIVAFDITVVDAYDATLTDNSMPKISPSGFLGVSSLTIGLVAKRTQQETTMFSAVFNDLIDFFGLPKMKLVGRGSDGTDTWVKLSQDMTQPIVLKSDDNDRFTYVVRDDLSGLKKFWISAACYEEVR